jgi:hypothetical protein
MGMPRAIVLSMMLLVWRSHPACAAQNSEGEPNGTKSARISLVGFEVGEGKLDLRYEITNGSSQDIWFCDDMYVNGKSHHETLLDADGHTVTIRRRLDVPIGTPPSHGLAGLFFGRHLLTFSRLRPGQRHAESLSFPLPMEGHRILSRQQPTAGVMQANRMVVQIGYYAGDLPGAIRQMLEEAESGSDDYPEKYHPSGVMVNEVDCLALYQLNSLNETLDDTTTRVTIPYVLRANLKEDCFPIRVDGVSISYREMAGSIGISRDRSNEPVPTVCPGGALAAGPAR